MGKKCNRCDRNKPYGDYYKNKDSPDGYYSICKACKTKYTKKRYKNNCKRDKVFVKSKHCPQCDTTKSRDLFYEVKHTKDGLLRICKECAKNNRRDNYDDSTREYLRKYYRKRRREDPVFRLKSNISTSIHQGAKIKSKNTYKILGISPNKLLAILNRNSSLNFNDDNSELDHIVPQSLANCAFEVRQLNH